MMAVLACAVILKGVSVFLTFFRSALQPSATSLIKVAVWSDSFMGFMCLFLQVLQLKAFSGGQKAGRRFSIYFEV